MYVIMIKYKDQLRLKLLFNLLIHLMKILFPLQTMLEQEMADLMR